MMRMKSNFLLISMVVTICSFIGEISIVGLIMFAIGFSMVVTVLELPLIYGRFFMKKLVRRILLAVGVMLSVIAFIEEISMVALVLFAVGFGTTVFVLNKMVEENEVPN